MYNLLPGEEQVQITDSVRSFLADTLPVERWRPGADCSDADHWQGMAGLGWFGLGVDETFGGVGYSLAEEVLLLRECGRFLVSPSVLATQLAAHLAAFAGQNELARGLTAGDHRVAIALPLAGTDAETRPCYVFDQPGCDLILIQSSDAQFDLVPVSALSKIDARPCLDETVSLCEAQCDIGAALCSADDSDGLITARLQVMCAAMLSGIAEAARDLSVDYAKVREQFGKPIGSFQAVKHMCTDMAVRAELAWAQTMEACLDTAHKQADAQLKAAAAIWLATDAAQRNGHAAIQVHGGIGFQAECNAHLFIKRSHVIAQLSGTLQQHNNTLLNAASPLD